MVIAWLLWPVYFHAFVIEPAPAASSVAALRTVPADSVLGELAAQRPLGPPLPDGAQAVYLADRWLDASRDPGQRGGHPALMQIRADDFVQDNGIGMLPFASLHAADVMVAAYRASGQTRHLAAARDLILAFARYERSAWRDRGLMWNDHPIAARVGVIVRFWAVYRSSPLFDPADAALILQHAARSARLLAAPSHFTAWSNHGVMQNVALLQAAAAFPNLGDAPHHARLALDRLSLQLGYYATDEGVVLEHSAGYQIEGQTLLEHALRLAQLNGQPIPQTLAQRLAKVREFSARLVRPDGSLPAYGDTQLQLPTPTAVPASTPRSAPSFDHALTLAEVSGYALWAAKDAAGATTSHSTLNWSYFPGLAHKHADELGLSIWAEGRGWITPSGYARYGSRWREPIERWTGSNAPHAIEERIDPARRAALRAFAVSSTTVLVDAQRSAWDGASFRRQVATLADGRWLVIDHSPAAASRPLETLWTFFPDLELEARGEARFHVRAAAGNGLDITLLAGPGARLRAEVHQGSDAPFAGWVVTPAGARPAPALRVLWTGPSWVAAVFDVTGAGAGATISLADAEHWLAQGPGWRLRRDGMQLVATSGEREDKLPITAARDVSADRAAIEAGLAAAQQAYPRHRDVDAYRLRMAAVLALLWALQVALCLVARGALRRRGWWNAARGAVVLAWSALATWLGTVYLAT